MENDWKSQSFESSDSGMMPARLLALNNIYDGCQFQCIKAARLIWPTLYPCSPSSVKLNPDLNKGIELIMTEDQWGLPRRSYSLYSCDPVLYLRNWQKLVKWLFITICQFGASIYYQYGPGSVHWGLLGCTVAWIWADVVLSLLWLLSMCDWFHWFGRTVSKYVYILGWSYSKVLILSLCCMYMTGNVYLSIPCSNSQEN